MSKFKSDKGSVTVELAIFAIIVIGAISMIMIADLKTQNNFADIKNEIDIFVIEVQAKGTYSDTDKLELQEKLNGISSGTSVEIAKNEKEKRIVIHVNYTVENLRGGKLQEKNIYKTIEDVEIK